MDKSEKLKNTIKKGKWHFILWHGVIGWGIPTAVLFKLIMHFTGETSFIDGLLTTLIIFPIGGIFFGAIIWVIMNRQYQKLKSE
jgi:hypothetical protein